MLARAAGHFDAFVTVDRNLAFQQRIDNLPFAVIVLRVDSVKQRDRLNDNHLGRLVGDDCRRLLVHVVAPVND